MSWLCRVVLVSMSPVEVVLLALMTIKARKWCFFSFSAFVHHVAVPSLVPELIPDVLILVFEAALDDVLQLLA